MKKLSFIALAAISTSAWAQQVQPVKVISGNVTATPLTSTPIIYTAGTIFDGRTFGSITFTCTVAPSGGAILVSPDNGSDYITQAAVFNSGTFYTTTATISAIGTYTISGYQYVQANFTDGTCFITGGQ